MLGWEHHFFLAKLIKAVRFDGEAKKLKRGKEITRDFTGEKSTLTSETSVSGPYWYCWISWASWTTRATGKSMNVCNTVDTVYCN